VTANGVDYYVYTNNTVTDVSGKVISTGGIEGLKTYLLSQTTTTSSTTTTTTVVADYQIVTANGVDYYVYTNNTVTDKSGKVISTGGIEGLKTYLLSQTATTSTTSTTSTTTTVPADYQIVTANNVDYYVYNNGSVYSAGKLVCSGGITGL
jgi:Flp pilus assembly protein TadG